LIGVLAGRVVVAIAGLPAPAIVTPSTETTANARQCLRVMADPPLACNLTVLESFLGHSPSIWEGWGFIKSSRLAVSMAVNQAGARYGRN
jgi:hypothetical protein